jgi:hypothetical protein
MIKNFRMNWDNEEHRYTFETMGCRITSLDVLNDLIGSLEQLHKKIADEYSYEDKLPAKLKVTGGCGWTHIEQGTK